MPPAHELTAAPSPRVPALSVPRVAVRERVALAVLALAALSFLIPSAPTYDPWAWIIWGREILHLDLVDRRRAVVEAAARAAHDAVRAVRRRCAPRPVAVRRARRGDRRRRRWSSASPGGSAGSPRAPPRRPPTRSRPGRCATRRSATRRACWSRSAVPPSTATSPAARAGGLPLRPRRRASAPRGLAVRRPLRPLAAVARARASARARAGRLRRAAGALAGARAVGLGRPAARRAPRPDAERRQRRLRRRPGRHAVLDQFTAMLLPPVWVGLGRARVVLLLRRGPTRSERRAVLGLARGGVVLGRRGRVMTSDGFSGNTRYLILPAALACVLAGVGVGWLVRRVPRRARRGRGGGRSRSSPPGLRRAERRIASSRARIGRLPGAADRRPRRRGRPRGRPRALLACGTPTPARSRCPRWRGDCTTPTAVRSASAPGDARRAGGRLPLQDDEHAAVPRRRSRASAGEAAVRTFAIAGGWRIVGRCR